VSRLCARKKSSAEPGRSIRAIRRTRRLSTKPTKATKDVTDGKNDSNTSTASAASAAPSASAYTFNWAELQRRSVEAAAAAKSDAAESVASTTTLVDGTQLTPQQLGLMGMEALETAVAYWEDALKAYEPATSNHLKQLTSEKESKARKMIESLLEETYHLQERAESMFIYQNSALYASAKDKGEYDAASVASVASKRSTLSGLLGSLSGRVASDDEDSFVSAQDTIADLADFDDLNEVVGELELGHVRYSVLDLIAEADPKQALYIQALELLEKQGIPYRLIRTDFVGCSSDSEYLAKLHCLRQAFTKLMADNNIRQW